MPQPPVCPAFDVRIWDQCGQAVCGLRLENAVGVLRQGRDGLQNGQCLRSGADPAVNVGKRQHPGCRVAIAPDAKV